MNVWRRELTLQKRTGSSVIKLDEDPAILNQLIRWIYGQRK